jgi:hypothetical protein
MLRGEATPGEATPGEATPGSLNTEINDVVADR